MTRLRMYLSLMRPDHWFKNGFMLPGFLFADALYYNCTQPEDYIRLLYAAISVCLVASANYVINEWLDASKDKYHPTKKSRSLVKQSVSKTKIILLYTIILLGGLCLAWLVSGIYFQYTLLFAIMGMIYNVPPIRAKERPLWDVATESINNPIRFALGWHICMISRPAPISVLIAYWMGGAFLMFAKRFAEYRLINDHKRASLYRNSFTFYNEKRLIICMFFSAILSSFFMGIFLMKHRIEFILSFPFFALLFSWYLVLAFRENSSVQYPERLLYRNSLFLLYMLFLVLLCYVLLKVELPVLRHLLDR